MMSAPLDAPAPRVSVVIPLFNARPFLAETVASIRAQAWPDLEILVVDDGSADGSPEHFAELCPEAILYRQANRGPSVARNFALERATGKYVTFLDSDDLWPPGKLARQVARLEFEPDLQATLGFVQRFSDEGSFAPDGRPVRAWGQSMFLFLLGGMVCRREFLGPDAVGGFDAARFPFMGEDTDWFFRAWESGRQMEIREETEIYYRRRAGSLTENVDETLRSFPGLVLTSLKRRRGPDGRSRPLPNTLRMPTTALT